MENTINKKAVAKAIFDEMKAAGKLVRKDVIARFMEEAHLSQAGASTYFFNFNHQWSNEAVAAKEAEKPLVVTDDVAQQLDAVAASLFSAKADKPKRRRVKKADVEAELATGS